MLGIIIAGNKHNILICNGDGSIDWSKRDKGVIVLMDIKSIGYGLENVHQIKIQAPIQKVSKTFSEELSASMVKASTTADPVNNKPIEYVVKKGDNLWNIGKKIFKVDPYQIARDNRLSNPDMLTIGQKLIINPSASNAVKSPSVQPTVGGNVTTASWYATYHRNEKTAGGERLNMNQNTLAGKTVPLSKKVRLVKSDNGRAAEGTIIDRGPYIKSRNTANIPDYDKIITKAAGKYNLDIALIKAVIKAESNFNHKAVSPAGAKGLMQLMPQTASALNVENVFHAGDNIEGGARYLSYLLKLYGGNKKLALAAYNAGEGAVAKYNNSVPPYRETQNYVRRVLSLYDSYSKT